MKIEYGHLARGEFVPKAVLWEYEPDLAGRTVFFDDGFITYGKKRIFPRKSD